MSKKLKGLMGAVLLLFSLAACSQGEVQTGKLQSLKETYDNGLLNEQDLMSIAYYHGYVDGVSETFTPTPKEPEFLSKQTVKKIRQVFFKNYVKPHLYGLSNITIDDVEISDYYGTYDGLVAIIMKNNFGCPGVVRKIVIGGITFEYTSCNDILIWIDN